MYMGLHNDVMRKLMIISLLFSVSLTLSLSPSVYVSLSPSVSALSYPLPSHLPPFLSLLSLPISLSSMSCLLRQPPLLDPLRLATVCCHVCTYVCIRM